MFRLFCPTLENLENREALSAAPLANMSLAALAANNAPAAIVGSYDAAHGHLSVASGDVNNDVRLHLARAVALGADFNPESASPAASNPPSISPINLQQVLAQDLFGDTMSMEEWMDWTAREHDPVNGDSIFDFPGGAGRQ
jgi:hypothetical protein